MSYLTGETTSASVWVTEPCVVLSWARDRLEAFLRDHPQQRLALQRVIGTDLVEKLRRRSPPATRNRSGAGDVALSSQPPKAVGES